MGSGGSTPAPPAGVKVLVKQRYQAYLPQHINKKATLTPEKVKLVHEHWNFIADEVRYMHFFIPFPRKPDKTSPTLTWSRGEQSVYSHILWITCPGYPILHGYFSRRYHSNMRRPGKTPRIGNCTVEQFVVNEEHIESLEYPWTTIQKPLEPQKCAL